MVALKICPKLSILHDIGRLIYVSGQPNKEDKYL